MNYETIRCLVSDLMETGASLDDAVQIVASANGLTYADVRAALEIPMDTTQVLSDEQIDKHLDVILQAAGSALKHYTMQKSKDDMRAALRAVESAVLAAQAQQVQAGWVMLGPDGSRFEGETPFKAASHAQKHRVRTDPEEARKFFAAVDQILQESAEENDRLLKEHGTLDCPACGGSGHIGDALSSAPPVKAQPQTGAISAAQTAAYAEGRGDQFEDDCAAVRTLIDELNDVDVMSNGFINTTRVRELIARFDIPRPVECSYPECTRPECDSFGCTADRINSERELYIATVTKPAPAEKAEGGEA